MAGELWNAYVDVHNRFVVTVLNNVVVPCCNGLASVVRVAHISLLVAEAVLGAIIAMS